MTALQQSEQQLVQLCSRSSAPVGFDWSLIITVLMPILVELLSGCLSRRTTEEIAAGLKSPGLLERVAIRRAVRIAAQESDRVPAHPRDQAHVAACVCSALQAADAGAITAALEEGRTLSDFLML